MTCSGVSDNRLSNPSTGECECLDRFYDDGSALTCASCHYSCFNCDNSKLIKIILNYF